MHSNCTCLFIFTFQKISVWFNNEYRHRELVYDTHTHTRLGRNMKHFFLWLQSPGKTATSIILLLTLGKLSGFWLQWFTSMLHANCTKIHFHFEFTEKFNICWTARYSIINIIMRIFLLLFYLITLKYQGQVACHQY